MVLVIPRTGKDKCLRRIFLPLSMIVVVSWAVRHYIQECNYPMITNEAWLLAPPTTVLHEQPRRQRKIYIDLGVNCGNSYYRFKEGRVKGSRTTLSSDDWETYLWEANPQMVEWYLNDLVAKERAEGRKVELIAKAAAAEEGTISLFLTKGQEMGVKREVLPNSDCTPNSPYSPSGASTIYGGAKRAGQEIKVPAVDFLAWFKSLQLQAGDIVHMKADIEGAELDIIEAFMADTTNQICLWSQYWSEYHSRIFPNGSEEQRRHEAFEKSLPGRFEDKCGRLLLPNGVLK